MSRGVISYVEQHPEWKTFSFQLSGDRTYYRAGKFFKFKEGDSVEFDTEVVGRNTKASKIRAWVGGEAAPAPSAAVVAASQGPMTQQDYWKQRELRDVDTQKRIELQSCRNSAIEFVKLLLTESVGAVKLPAKQAEKAIAVEELVAHYTDNFVKENKNGKAVVSQEPTEAVNPASEPATTTKTTDENNNDDWN